MVIGLMIVGSIGLMPRASAAPFCVVDFAGERCWYKDYDSCVRAAGEQGECVVKPDTMVAPVGGAAYCLVESWQTQCNYATLAACERESQRRHATCIPHPGRDNSR
jgi:hypothetical protein